MNNKKLINYVQDLGALIALILLIFVIRLLFSFSFWCMLPTTKNG